MHRGLAAPALGAALAFCLLATAGADDFRIETKVYAGKEKAPVSQTTTLFRAGFVYDYLADPQRVAVFDQTRGRFIVLDPERKLRAELKADEVRTFVDGLHDLAAKGSNPAMRFAADPQFEIEFSESGRLTLTSKHITYELETEPAASPEAARQYHEFSDWYARFNTRATGGSLPFARMVVNAELAKRGLVPSEVKMTFRNAAARSEHLVTWRLLEGDQKRIAETENQLTTFKVVDFEDLQAPAISKR
jgi:hypothetical protein